jgi:hypothetical protein
MSKVQKVPAMQTAVDWIENNALFSEDRKYRYRLFRKWGRVNNAILWIMLNPSTADEIKFDPTVRRCFGFSKDWGYSEMLVCNLFALRSTDPKALYKCDDPIGPDNLRWIKQDARYAERVIIAWGNHSNVSPVWKTTVLTALDLIKPVYCMGKTKAGEPKHPLYLSAKTKPILYE